MQAMQVSLFMFILCGGGGDDDGCGCGGSGNGVVLCCVLCGLMSTFKTGFQSCTYNHKQENTRKLTLNDRKKGRERERERKRMLYNTFDTN